MSHRRSTSRRGLIALGLAAATVAAGCAGPQAVEPAKGKAQGKKNADITIGYVTKSASNQGWVIINKGAAAAAKEAGVKLVTVGPDEAESLSGQQNALENMVNRKVDAIALAPVDSAAVAPSVEKASGAGIPVVAVDTDVTGAEVSSFVATDSVKAGKLQGEWVAKHVPADGEVVVVNGQLSQSTGKDRYDGFRKGLRATRPNVKVYQVQTKWDQSEAQNGVEALLRAHPRISLVANAWDGGTMGTVAALQGAGKKKGEIKVVGLDGDPNALKAMKKGWVQADVAQRLYVQGHTGIDTAVKAAKGEQVNKRVDTGEVLVTPANVDSFAKANHLTPYLGSGS